MSAFSGISKFIAKIHVIIAIGYSCSAFPAYACQKHDNSLSYNIISTKTSHFMSINGGVYFPCWEHEVYGDFNWVCGKKDLFGFFGLGNSVKFDSGLARVIDNRGAKYLLDWGNAWDFQLKDCQNLENGKLKLIYERNLEALLLDKRFSRKDVLERIVKGYRPSLNINQ